jgi:hypothetical protein
LTLEILQTQRKYLTPLAEVLEEKIKRNREKFGKYKLISASETKENLQRFETDSDGDEEKQLGVARDIKCPEEILHKLAKNGTAAVKLAVLDHQSCGFNIITLLRDDPDPAVKAKVDEKFMQSESGIIETARNGKREQKIELTKLSNVPDDALNILANDTDRDVLIALLQYPFLPESVWHILVNKGDENLNELILANQKCPESVRKRLDENCSTCMKFYLSSKNNPHCQGIQGRMIDPKVAYKNCGKYRRK